jgi:hypothetical protein
MIRMQKFCLYIQILLLSCFAQSQSLPSLAVRDEVNTALPENRSPQVDLYLKVRLEKSVKLSRLKPGTPVEGALVHDVYSRTQLIFPQGAHVRLVVDHLGRRKRTPNDHWPWVVKAFTPRRENYPVFQSASILLPDNRETTLAVQTLSVAGEREVHAKPKPGKASAAPATENVPRFSSLTAQLPNRNSGSTLTLEAVLPVAEAKVQENAAFATQGAKVAGGTTARIVLLGDISASKNRKGDIVQARLIEPVQLDASLLPAGTLFQGQVVKSRPPRTLSRSGSIMVKFTSLTLPDGNRPISAWITAAELDRRSHTTIDSEGVLRGDRPGKVWMLLNAGVTGGLAKEVDDGTQLLIEAIVSTATDASTAGTARIAATCVSGIFMLTRHGRDVMLPKFTEMEISFDRPVSGSAPIGH